MPNGDHGRHMPLRLSVFIQAPQEPIDSIVATHATVRQLVDNGWLHLFRLDDASGCWRYLPRSGRQESGRAGFDARAGLQLSSRRLTLDLKRRPPLLAALRGTKALKPQNCSEIAGLEALNAPIDG